MTRLDILFRKIRDSFTVEDTNTVVFILVIMLVIALLIVLPLIISAFNRKRIRERALAYYRELAELYRLDEDEEAVLDQLSRYLRHPWKKYLLITNPRSYIATLHKLISDRAKFTQNEEKLAQKFSDRNYDQFRCPENTMEFRKNHQIIVIHHNNTCIARIESSDDTAFYCEKVSGEAECSPGSQVIILYPYGNGISVGNSVVEASEDNNVKMVAVDMDRPSEIEYNDLEVEVFVKKVQTGTVLVPGTLKRINGKDFILKFERHRFKRGNDVKIFFTPVKGAVPVNAEIMVSKKNKVIANAGYLS